MKNAVIIPAFILALATHARAQDYEFKGGYPTPKAAEKTIDDTDLARAVTAYRFFYPTVSMEATFQGTRDAGAKDSKGAMILAGAPRHTLFTGNAGTPYMGGVVNLKETGPLVIELPAGPYLGIVNDHNFGWVQDIGLPGPDAGKGGKHLIVPPDYKGESPAGYYAARSKTNYILVAARALPPGGDMKAGLDAQRKIKVYPLAQAAKPPSYEFVDRTNDKVDVTLLRWEDNLQFWEKLHKVLQEEPAQVEFRPMYGMLANLGVEKGKPFAPDARMRAILERAAKIGRDQMLIAGFGSSRPDRFVWPDRRWEYATLRWENGDFELPTGIDLEARDRWFSQAVGMSPKMVLRVEGAGSLYWLGLRDKNGNYLDGGKTYKLSVPQPVPQKLFWSVTVYDAGTRSMIQTDQEKAALRSLVELKNVPKSGPPTSTSARPYRLATRRGGSRLIRAKGGSAPLRARGSGLHRRLEARRLPGNHRYGLCLPRAPVSLPWVKSVPQSEPAPPPGPWLTRLAPPWCRSCGSSS